jgi:serine protease AprX
MTIQTSPQKSRGRPWIHLLATLALLAGLVLSATALSAEDMAEPGSPATTEDGRIVVIVILKEQPFHEASQAVWDEYEPRLEALQQQVQALAARPWQGPPLATIEEELAAVRNAPTLPAAEQEQITTLQAQVDALDTELRREMLDRAWPALEASQSELVQTVEGLGGEVLYRYSILNGVAAAIPPGSRATLEARPDVAEVADDQLMSGHLGVSVPSIFAGTWWSAGYTGGSYDVGVVDSGVDDTHPGLSSQFFCENRCLATADAYYAGMPGFDPSVDDVNGHGSHVAGIVASTNTTYRGVAYGLDAVFNCKAGFDKDGNDGGGAAMYWSDGMACIDWALVNSTCGDYADVLNLSYGGSTSSDDTPFARFWDAVVDDLRIPSAISAGNDGPSNYTVGDPSIAYNVLTVANMDDQNTTYRTDDTIRSSSSRGPTANGRKKPDITAPGTYILSANNNWEGASDWVSMSGTSMAAPHVAGGNLLLVQYQGKRPPVQKAILINTSADWGSTGWDTTYGWGYIDLDHAYFHRDDWFYATISDAPDFDLYKGPAYNADAASLVWHRRTDYASGAYPNTYYSLSNLDLHLYREDTDETIAASTSSIDNVEQVKATGTYPAVLKVDAWSGSFQGVTSEWYALATEEGFTAASGPAFGLGTTPYSQHVGDEWIVTVTVNNTGDLHAHNVAVSLTLPAGLSRVSGANPQALATIADGSAKSASWRLRATAPGSYSVPIEVSSYSYQETFAGLGSFRVRVTARIYLPAIQRDY